VLKSMRIKNNSDTISGHMYRIITLKDNRNVN
jgi:hypothetical protein